MNSSNKNTQASTKTECDYPCGYILKRVTYAKISPKIWRDTAWNAEDEEEEEEQEEEEEEEEEE